MEAVSGHHANMQRESAVCKLMTPVGAKDELLHGHRHDPHLGRPYEFGLLHTAGPTVDSFRCGRLEEVASRRVHVSVSHYGNWCWSLTV